MRKSLIFLIIFILLAFISMGIFIAFQTGFIFTRASVPLTSFSADNSYVFASPLRAQANGEEKIRVTVFVLNGQGLGVPGRNVELPKNPNLLIDGVQPTTDNVGKAVFDIATRTAGVYTLSI